MLETDSIKRNPMFVYLVVLTTLAITLLIVHRLVHSRFGRLVLAIRDDDVRAEAVGVPVFRYKLLLFIIAGALGGLAGALRHGGVFNGDEFVQRAVRNDKAAHVLREMTGKTQ